MRTLLVTLLLCGAAPGAEDPYAGLWQGFDGEWGHVSRQLLALAEATPAAQYAYRPASGVRTMAEVYMHLAAANFGLAGVTGVVIPADAKAAKFDQIKDKAEVVAWLRRSLEFVRTARAGLKPGDLERKVKIAGREATVDGMYLRIIVHANEHMGQLIAYARGAGITPPWSKKGE